MDEKTECACGATETTSTTAPAASGAPMLPQKANEPCRCMSGKRLFPWGILIFLLLLLAGVWLWIGDGKRDEVFGLIPVKANSVRVINCNHTLLTNLSRMPLWNDSAKAEIGLAAGFAGSFYKDILFRRSELDTPRAVIAGMVERAAVAELEGELLYILYSNNTHAIEKIILKDVAKDFQKERDSVEIDQINFVRKLNIPGVMGAIYLLRANNTVILTRSKDLLQKALRCQQRQESSLADIGLGWPDESGQRTVACMYVVPSLSNFIFLNLTPTLYRPDSAMFSTFNLGQDGFDINVRVINNGKIVGGTGPGVLYYIGVVLLVAVIIVIGAPVAFLVATLLLALYFYLMAWWKNELIPIEPAELPELSPQLKEDLAGKDSADKDADKQA